MRRLHLVSRGAGPLGACLLAIGLSAAGGSLAQPTEEPVGPALRWGGFGTAGIARTSAPPGWGFQRESAQAPNDDDTRVDIDSRLGLQANYAIGPRFELVGQLLLMRRFQDAKPGDAIAWAFAAYRPTENLNLRLGRINADLYLLSDYRSVGFAYPFVRPPIEYYSLLASSYDGIDAAYTWRGRSDAIWRIAGIYGQGKQSDNRSGGYRTVRPAYGFVVSREEQGLLVKAGASRGVLATDTPALVPLRAALQTLIGLPVASVAADAATLQRQLTLAGQVVHFYALGVNLDRHDWLWMLELNRLDIRGTKELDAGYVLLGRRFGSLTPYAVWSAIRTRLDEARRNGRRR